MEDQVMLVEAPKKRLPPVAFGPGAEGLAALKQRLEQNRVRLERGLLSQADQNVLYIDEVNLLDEQIVDAILDAAAQGQYTVRRGPLAATYRSRLVLIGTMNPEEGLLRPQIQDRFGLRWCARFAKANRLAIHHRAGLSPNPYALAIDWLDETRAARRKSPARTIIKSGTAAKVERLGLRWIRELKIGFASHRWRCLKRLAYAPPIARKCEREGLARDGSAGAAPSPERFHVVHIATLIRRRTQRMPGSEYPATSAPVGMQVREAGLRGNGDVQVLWPALLSDSRGIFWTMGVAQGRRAESLGGRSGRVDQVFAGVEIRATAGHARTVLSTHLARVDRLGADGRRIEAARLACWRSVCCWFTPLPKYPGAQRVSRAGIRADLLSDDAALILSVIFTSRGSAPVGWRSVIVIGVSSRCYAMDVWPRDAGYRPVSTARSVGASWRK
jgi:hypothetical protein